MTVWIHNTLTQKKDEVRGRGLDPMHINMYVCGPTVYDSPHLGHARSYIFFDTLRRTLLLDSYTVKYIQNFSDIDEKIDLRAVQENVIPSVISERYRAEFLGDMDALNVLRSDVYTSASHIKGFMHRVTGILLRKGVCYRAGDNIYFDAASGGGFGSLLHDSLDNLVAGNEADTFRFDKRDKQDFVIWLGDYRDDSVEESEGRPSWNLECFSIVHRQVGCELDIQGGGLDLIFPHHEVASVISKSYCGVEFANYYIHNAFVTSRQDKMSKSTQNYVALTGLLEKYGADAIRMYLLSSHFMEGIEYDEEELTRWKDVSLTVSSKLEGAGILGGDRTYAPHSGVPGGGASGLMDALRDDMHTEKALDLFVEMADGYPGNGVAPDELKFACTALGLFGFTPAAPDSHS